MALKSRDKFIASQAIQQAYPSEVDANGYFISHPETELNQVVGLARQNSTAYAVGNIAFSSSILPLFLKCTTAGTTAAAEPDMSSAIAGGTITDGTAVWTYINLIPDLSAYLTRELTPAFNKRDEITTSGTYTAPVTGWYRITAKGGGGGGAGGGTSGYRVGGRGGGEGGTTVGYEKMTAGQTASVVIGGGGAAGANGGASTVTVNSTTYTGGGGQTGGAGGSGTIYGAPGGAPASNAASSSAAAAGGSGGGNGGANIFAFPGVNGGGGAGSSISSGGSVEAPSAGGNGYVWFEYFDATL